MKNRVKKVFKKSLIFNKVIVFLGVIYFHFFKKTPKICHQSLINLYIITNGSYLNYLDNLMSKKTSVFSYNLSKFFGKPEEYDFQEINNVLNKKGYYKLNNLLENSIVKNLNTFSSTICADVNNKKILYDKNNIISEIYRYNDKDLLNNKILQDLIMDPILINIARNYFKAEPIFDFIAMWRSTDFLKKASSEAAQMYHFDLDRIKWLKVFIYLSDVTEKNGPHSYIESSHLSGQKPDELLSRGYVRIEDSDLEKHYSKNKFKTVKGKAGTVLIGDTKCWHKGNPIIEGERLMLQLEYSTSDFGINKSSVLVNNPSNELRKFKTNNMFYCQNLIIH